MTGPQDPAAAGEDRLRAGHADREQVIEALKVAFVHGRLTKDELDTRAGRALSAQTRADLAALTADIPAVPSAPASAGLTRPSASPRRWPGRPPSRAAAWPSRSPSCCSPPTFSIRMASAIPIIPGAACVLSWPLAS
jgi:hypothetical protein